VTYGLDPQRLLHDGVVLPAGIVLSHESELGRLGRSCPEALPVASVIGDSSYDRLIAGLPHRDAYRRALAVDPDQKLVVVSSTWGPGSLFGRWPRLLPRLIAELPRREYRIVMLLHPNVWFGHGAWQVSAWLADCRRNGLSLVPPEADWRAVLVAADWVIGDHGSATLYGTAGGAPVMLAGFPRSDVDPASALARLAAVAPRISRLGSLRDQLARAAEVRPDHYRSVTDGITSAPGRFDRNMRRLMYRLLDLRQPATIPVAAPASMPFLST